jgi:MFS family permease
VVEGEGRSVGLSRPLIALIIGQIGLHACMAGVRMAAPLLALRSGHAALAVGIVLALFAVAPIALALPAGRLADRHGYHRPVRIAVVSTAAGGLVVLLAAWLGGAAQLPLLCIGATLTGAGANIGLIAIQHTAGRTASDATERMRVFSWLGIAPSFANVIGPVMAGVLIDASGFVAAFAAMALLPLATVWCARQVPMQVPPRVERAPARTAWKLLLAPGMPRLLFVNWLISASWDLHTFLLPILGHERGFSASAIGIVLGVFALAVTAVRLLIPFIAHRMSEAQVLGGAMLVVAAVFAVYPLARSPWLMGACAVLLGLALGAVQPMIMSTLHHITPDDRHGEVIALRSMTINFSSALMPLVFGLVGVAVGASALFWAMGATMAAGSWGARRIGRSA